MSSEKDKLSRFDNGQLKKQLKIWQAKQSKFEGCKINMEDIIADLADRAHIPDETIKNWKKGYNKPKTMIRYLSLQKH